MPRVIVTEGAARGLERCRIFLASRNPGAAVRAAETIRRGFRLLATNPDVGRPMNGDPAVRELVIGFGETGYLALYRHDLDQDTVHILAFRHQREAGYR